MRNHGHNCKVYIRYFNKLKINIMHCELNLIEERFFASFF